MSIRRSSVILAITGVLLIVLAGVIRFVVVPNATKMPGDTDETVRYSGTATMLNSAALQANDLSKAIVSNIPVTAVRRIKVESTHGDTAIVKDSLTVQAGGQALPSSHTYAVNRSDLKGVTAPRGVAVEPAKGALTVGFPPGPKSDDTALYYDSTTRSMVHIKYTGKAKREGRRVNVYKISVSGAVKDPATLASLPPALPKSLLTGLVPTLPPAARAQFTPDALKALPDAVPMTYTGITDVDAYIDRQTGIAIEQTISQQVVAGTTLGSQQVALLPVLKFDLRLTPASIKELGDKAASAGLLLTLMKTAAPITLLAVAALLILLAFLRRRRPDQPAPGTPATATTSAESPASESR